MRNQPTVQFACSCWIGTVVETLVSSFQNSLFQAEICIEFVTRPVGNRPFRPPCPIRLANRIGCHRRRQWCDIPLLSSPRSIEELCRSGNPVFTCFARILSGCATGRQQRVDRNGKAGGFISLQTSRNVRDQVCGSRRRFGDVGGTADRSATARCVPNLCCHANLARVHRLVNHA